MFIIQGYCLEIFILSELSKHTGVLSGVWLSAELKDKHLHTGLGGVCGVLQGVVRTGLNEVCSMLETCECKESFLMEWVTQWYLNHSCNLHEMVTIAG